MFSCSVIPRLVLRMTPQYDLSIQQDDVLAIECTVETLDSLTGISNGFLVIQKDELVLPGNCVFFMNRTYNQRILNTSSLTHLRTYKQCHYVK